MPAPLTRKLTNWVHFNAWHLPRSFQARLVVVFTGFFLLFVWVLVWASSTVLQTQFSKTLADQQFAFTQVLAAELHNKLAERTRALRAVAATLPAVLSAEATGSLLAQRETLQTLFSAGVAVIGLDGKCIGEDVGIAEWCAGGIGEQPYFIAVMATGEPYIDRPRIDPASARPLLTFAVPLFDAAGKPRAVMAGRVDLVGNAFFDAIAAPANSVAGNFFVVSPRDKLILAATDARQFLAAAPGRGVNPMYDQFIDGVEGAGVASDAKEGPVLISGKYVSRGGWLVVATLPASLAFGPFKKLQYFIYFIAGIMTLAGVFTVRHMVRRMLAPLDNAGRAMCAIADGGEPLAPLPIELDDEIGRLIGHFNRLAEQRRRYEAALSDSEQRFRLLVERAPDGIFVQIDARFAYVNPEAVRLFGATGKEQLLGLPVASRVHPDFRGVVADRIRATNEAGKNTPPLVLKYLSMDGNALDVETSSSPCRYGNEPGSLVFVRDIGERIRAGENARDSEARYRSLFDNMLGGYAYCQMIFENGQAQDFIYLDVNPAFGRLTGLVNVVGKKISELMPGILESNSELFGLYGGVALGGAPVRFATYVEPLGEWFEVSAYGAKAGYFIAVFDVITGRVNAEGRLRKQAEEVRALVENSPDMIVRYDRDFRCVYANSKFEAAAGAAHDALLGKRCDEIGWPHETAAKCKASLTEVMASGCPATFELSLAAPEGERFYHVKLAPEFCAEGLVLNVVAVARDISVLKGVEATLRESERKIHGITANVPGIVFQCLMSGCGGALQFSYVSDGSLALLGVSPGAILADPHAVTERVGAQDRDAFYASLRHSAMAADDWNWDGRVALDDGAEKWINCRATSRRCGDGGVIWDGVMLDVTESKRGEQALRQSGQLLRELSGHVEGVREEERKRIAREVHDELGQALTVLRMDLSMLRLNFGEQNPQLLERVLSMTEGLDRTIQMVRHITSSLRPVALDLGLVAGLEWLVEEFNHHAGAHCHLRTVDCEEVGLDDGRVTALFRIVQESLANVARHAEASEVEVAVELENDNCVHLDIRDDGKGFDPQEARKPGSFGLIGIRERVLMLNGTVTVDSVAGQGTRVEVRIPLTIADSRFGT